MPERRVAIFVGPEYGTVSRADLTAAAREAMEAGFDLLVAAAFNFDAHAGEFDRMGALTVLQAQNQSRSAHARSGQYRRATCSPCLANPTLPCTMKARA
jgi:hypothetical protein